MASVRPPFARAASHTKCLAAAQAKLFAQCATQREEERGLPTADGATDPDGECAMRVVTAGRGGALVEVARVIPVLVLVRVIGVVAHALS
jgi:hypothetical protein